MARQKKPQTKTSLVISVAVHALVIALIFYWAAKTGIIPEQVSRVFNIAPTKKKEEPKKEPPKEPPKPTKQEVKEQTMTPPTPPPSGAAPALTAKKADPNAPPAMTTSPFTAEARTPGVAPAPVIQPQTTVGSGKPGSTGTGRGVGASTPSMFSTNATKPSTVASVLEERKLAVVAQDAISSEQIAKSGSSDAAAVVSKVAGASIVEGKFVVVRGLSDRYNTTTLNGADIPTADPYRKAAQLDLIPSTMVDRIVVNKTFTPDQPGGFAGGAVNVVTKSFPARPILTLSLGGEYNTQASLNDRFLSYDGGSTDWLGIDDGTRALPSSLENGPPGLPPSAGFSGRPPRPDTPQRAAERRAQADAVVAALNAFNSQQFTPVRSTAPLNHNFSLAAGDTLLLFGQPFGVFGGLSYKREFNFYEDGVSARYNNNLLLTKHWSDTKATELVSWGAAVNLAWQPFEHHEIGFSFLHNQNSENIGRRRLGEDLTTGSPGDVSDLSTLQFIERQLHTFQLKGRDAFPDLLDARLDWLAAFSNTSQDEPDLRYFNYFHSPDGSAFVFNNNSPEPRLPTRYFRKLEEDNFNAKADLAVPVDLWDGLVGELKTGVFTSNSERTYKERTFTYNGNAGFTDPLDPNTFLPGNLYYNTTTTTRGTNYQFVRYLTSELGNSSYRGQQDIHAFYAMATVPVAKSLRLVGGVRFESTDLRISSDSAAVGGANAVIQQTDLLPAAGVICDLRSNLTLRLSFSQTITRPTYREIAAVRSYDLPTDTLLDGNPNLQITAIKNYDARLEWFPRPGEVFAASVFYKDLTQPIEKYSQNQEGTILTYINRDAAKLYGVELEARKSLDFLDPLLSGFSLGMNLSIIKSEVKVTDIERNNKGRFATDTRPLYDQSPYILNADFNYDNPWLGTSVTLTYSLAGERIFFVNPSGPDIYEHPPTTLDLVISQRLTPHLRLKFSAKNLLDPAYQVTYDKRPDENVYTSYKRGRTFGVSLAYDF